jgi:hypothetical protein
MKHIAILLALSFAALAQQPNHSSLERTRAINAFIERQLAEPAGGYFTWRTDYEGDVYGNGPNDVIALYAIESEGGGNTFSMYLAAFRRSRTTGKLEPGVRWRVGGKMTASFNSLDVNHGVIRLTGSRWLPNDPGCCPTGKIDIRLKLAADHRHLEPAPDMVLNYEGKPVWDSSVAESQQHYIETQKYWAAFQKHEAMMEQSR